MGATSRARTLTHAVTETAYSREFLERMARILVHSGHSPRQLVREFRGICSALKEPKHRWDPRQLAYLADLPEIIALWHADLGSGPACGVVCCGFHGAGRRSGGLLLNYLSVDLV
jgi:hypothetical protein